MDSILNIF
jgi:hypothetical protein